MERYEDLRQYVLAGSPIGGGLGLVWLLRSGMAGWAETWAAYPRILPPRTNDSQESNATFAATTGAELVSVLATMALSRLAELGA